MPDRSETDHRIGASDKAEARDKTASRRVLKVGELPASIVDALRRFEMGSQHSHLDLLMDK
jgi:hypothetical protein